MRAAAIAVILAGSATVHADTASDDYHPPEVALAWSGLPLLGGIALFAGGIEAAVDGGQTKPFGKPMAIVGAAAILVGPTLGHIYAGTPWSRWLGVRAAAAVGMAAGVASLANRDAEHCNCGGVAGLTLASGAVFTIATVGEVITAPSAAADYNDAHKLKLAPVPDPRAPGVMLTGMF